MSSGICSSSGSWRPLARGRTSSEPGERRLLEPDEPLSRRSCRKSGPISAFSGYLPRNISHSRMASALVLQAGICKKSRDGSHGGDASRTKGRGLVSAQALGPGSCASSGAPAGPGVRRRRVRAGAKSEGGPAEEGKQSRGLPRWCVDCLIRVTSACSWSSRLASELVATSRLTQAQEEQVSRRRPQYESVGLYAGATYVSFSSPSVGYSQVLPVDLHTAHCGRTLSHLTLRTRQAWQAAWRRREAIWERERFSCPHRPDTARSRLGLAGMGESRRQTRGTMCHSILASPRSSAGDRPSVKRRRFKRKVILTPVPCRHSAGPRRRFEAGSSAGLAGELSAEPVEISPVSGRGLRPAPAIGALPR